MGFDPFKNSTDEANRVQSLSGMDVGIVVAVSPENHMVAVREVTATGEPVTETKPTSAAVAVDQKGDVNLPDRGDLVVLARFKGGAPVVLGTYYTQQKQIRDSEPGERHIGSDDGEGVFIHGPFGVAPKLSKSVSDAPDGSVWYREDLGEYRGMEDETKVSFDTTAV